MLIVMSWLREYVEGLPPTRAVADALIRAGFEVEGLRAVGADVSGVVVGEVVGFELVETKKKSVRWCQVRVAEPAKGEDPAGGVRGVICGAHNFAVGDRVAVALPGAMLPGGFAITARRTYGHVSDGMICSARELGLGEDHDGILVLPPPTPLGADVTELLDLADEVLDIAVTPDRGYALSVRGIAREAATAFALPFRDPGDSGGDASGAGEAYPVVVEDTAGCDRYVARVVTGVDPAATTPLSWSRRLSLSGMRSISVPVDVTNAVLLGLGQPLHAFDRAKLTGPIVVRRAVAGEKLRTLDDVERVLDPEDLVIADDSGPIALAGVMGGAATEISAETTDIVLESAHFDAISVARTARRHRLSSEASRRFERGVDPALAPVAAAVAVDLLTQLAGAQAVPGVTDVDHRAATAPVPLPLDEAERLAGRPYPAEVIRRRLADVGCAITEDDAGRGDVLAVVAPSWRPDLTRPADLVEEIVRLEGYDTIPVTLPRLPAARGITPAQRMRRAVGRALAHAGFVEVLTLPFVAQDAADMLGLAADDPRRAAVRVANPIAEDAAYLRTTLLSGLIAAAVRNIGRGQQDLALFEAGLVFRELPGGPPVARTPPVDRRPTSDEIAALDATLPTQPRHVAALLTGRREPGGWASAARAADWADAVDAAHLVAESLGLSLTVTAGDTMPWHPGRCAALSVAGRRVGHAGELHPRVLGEVGLPPRAVAMELDLDALIDAATAAPPIAAPTISTYPPADRDVALVVPTRVPVAEVTAALREGAGELLESLALFDVFEGAQVGPGQRSLAFGLRLRAADRTLTAAEANAARDAAVARAADRTGAALRA
ncbi:Phenylalanine--tRNA ligase beta subunit [Frankia canadensis]|uniref:Phenylalanine--tRNA ligase beta subunit n=1 Tax=Frankia canadensis TaxID=1836972 RepID=A0A2I2KZ56_9ACTN|nr:phenylalanine--tRNA ligase subunit beta [Frankia canadensis]SNQ50939.1 Phenylalanine--tRNA ligase beta subunit [Frankia canadensis]SOU58229.1 Phenylalanine--tRNA ligase beta subunit [Frankia canadensis]